MKIRPHVRPASKGADEGWAVLSTLISGFVVFGGIGWLLDQWWGTRMMVPIGLVVGMALSIYAVVKQFGGPRGEHEAQALQAAKTEREQAGTSHQTTAAQALRAAKAANRSTAYHRARAAHARQSAFAPPVHSPSDGPPPASTRRETECL